MYFYFTCQPKLNKEGIKVHASFQNHFRSWQVFKFAMCVCVCVSRSRT